MNEFIQLKNVYKTYSAVDSDVNALDGINISINKGDFTAIVGPSGSGKSTFMNILGCLDTPSSGEYLLDGFHTQNFTDRQLSDIRSRKIGFIFQSFNLIPSLTALENVELPLIYKGIPRTKRRKIAVESLEKVSLSARMEHLPSQMSGGQQQRVAVARALCLEPPLILADEPTGNLDSHSGKEVMDIICDLHKSGRTVVLITHDMNVAKRAECIFTISDGKIYNKA